MSIIGAAVKHKAFGRGIIKEVEETKIVVVFDESKEEKKFDYPFVFDKFMVLENEDLLETIQEDKIKLLIKKEAKRIERRKLEEKEKIKNGKKLDTIDKNNIAFKCNYCDGGKDEESIGFKGVCSDKVIKYNIKTSKHVWCKGEDSMCRKYLDEEITREELLNASKEEEFICYESKMMNSWRAYAGVYQSGENKGKPMALKNVTINSLAVLTTRMPYGTEKERLIFSVFLIRENFEGGSQEEGFVEADPKFKLSLSMDEAKELRYWDYYFNQNKPESIRFGSGLHRYLTDEQSAQILKKICEIKKGTDGEEFAKEFLAHYCGLKILDVENIAIPNGALKRIL